MGTDGNSLWNLSFDFALAFGSVFWLTNMETGKTIDELISFDFCNDCTLLGVIKGDSDCEHIVLLFVSISNTGLQLARDELVEVNCLALLLFPLVESRNGDIDTEEDDDVDDDEDTDTYALDEDIERRWIDFFSLDFNETGDKDI